MPILRAYREPDAKGDKPVEAGRGEPMFFTAATAGKKPDGLDLAGLPWDFSRAVKADDGAMQYPFLWVHDIGGERPPLGVANIVPGDEPLPLRIAVTFDPEDAFAVEIERKYRSPVGGLAAVSIQWDDMDEDGMPARATKAKPVAHQLWEVSAVPVGMDPDALKDGARAAMRAIYDDLGAMLDTEPEGVLIATTTDGIPVYDLTGEDDTEAATETHSLADVPDTDSAEDHEQRLAAAMVAVFTANAWSDDADGQRHATYKGLLAPYKRAGWTAPEFLPLTDLRALDDGTWRGLFLSGELQRVGAELSTKNVAELREIDAALRDASKRLGAMLSRVTSGKTDTPAEDTRSGDTEDDFMAALAALQQGMKNDG